jgi:ABC-type nitrate/sulfonate/bicarbonate transport system permease component
MKLHWLFRLKGDLLQSQRTALTIAGIIFVLIFWAFLTGGSAPLIPPSIFPHPGRVWVALTELYSENNLLLNICRSLGLNFGGYIKAIAYAIPIGFAIGLVPVLRGAFQKMVDAIRFLPLTALTGLFIVWYGIYAEQKINFLAFGIFIYLLPIVIQRIDEVEDVYLKTVHTLGASYWQTIRTVYFPSVISRISDDIRILTAISWTYIIVAETSADQGGIGSLIYRTGQRLGRVDKTVACLLIIMLIGIIQDRLFAYLDRKFFPFKYQTKETYTPEQGTRKISLWDEVTDYIFNLSSWLLLLLYVIITVNEFSPFIGNMRPLHYLFGETVWTIHVIFGSMLFFKIYAFMNSFKSVR